MHNNPVAGTIVVIRTRKRQITGEKKDINDENSTFIRNKKLKVK